MTINPENFDEELEPKIKEDMGNKPPRATKEELDADREPPFTVPSSIGNGRGFMGKLTQGGIGFQILITVVLIGLTVIGLMPTMFVSKNDFEVNLANVAASIDTLNQSVTSMKSQFSEGMNKVNGALNDISNIPSTIEHQFNQVLPREMKQYEDRIKQLEDDLNVTKVQEDLAALSQSIGNARTDISAVGTKLNNFIDTFTDNLTTIQEQIDGLGTGSSGGTTDIEENSDVYIEPFGDQIFTLTKPETVSETEENVSIAYRIVNDSPYKIKNISLRLTLYPYINNVLLSRTSVITDTMNLIWMVQSGDYFFVAEGASFGSGSPFGTMEIKSGSNRLGSINALLRVTGNNWANAKDDVTFYAIVEVVDYDIVK